MGAYESWRAFARCPDKSGPMKLSSFRIGIILVLSAIAIVLGGLAFALYQWAH